MTASLRALLEGVIDYAGLFPPAQLPLEQAFPNYLRYRREPESWMLGRFVIPAGRLPELDTISGSPTGACLSVLSGSGHLVGLELKRIRNLREKPGVQYQIDSVEIKIRQSVSLIRKIAIGANALELDAFFEFDAWDDIPNACQTLASALPPTAQHAAIGLKLRCGGLEAAAFPSPDQVAFVITACRDALVPLKFTAGLHHPIRHYNESVKTKMHGFVNVFGAGVLAHRHRLTEEQVRQIIEDEDPAHFVFDDECFRWKDWRATVQEIRLARQMAVTSFGSCSFDEPRDDLRKLGLL